MDEKKNGEEVVVTPTTPETPVETPAPSQDPIKAELEKVRKPKTEAEKAAYSLVSNAKRVKELGLDPKSILGFETPTVEDDTPVTHGDLKRIQQTEAQKTALILAEEQIQNEDERELTKYHLENTIKPSGDPKSDLRNARALVNSVKNSQFAEEAARVTKPKTIVAGGSVPAVHEPVFEPTQEEIAYMRPPFNMTKDAILKARKAEQARRG